MKKNIFVRGILFLTSALFSCGQKKADTSGLPAFSLKNGIPVYCKSVDSTRMASVLICVRGGSALFSREYSGIERELFELVSRGGKNHSYDDLLLLDNDKNISLGHSELDLGSYMSLSCLSSYLEEGLSALLDCFLNPSFDKTQFDNMMTECDQSLQRMQADPERLLFYTINKEIYKDHPLSTSASVLPESRQNITMENLKAHYKKILDAKRIFVVAAGDVNLRKLKRTLEKTLGNIPSLENDFSIPEIPDFDISGQTVSLKSSALAKGSGHIALVFKSPSFHSKDLAAARLAASMYGESLFNIVRTKYGACYTPSTSAGFSPAPCGMVFLFRVSDMENAASYIPEAEEDFLGGDIEGNLKGYVKKYINSAYQNQMSCAAIASRSANALLSLGDIDGFDKIADAAKKLTAADVRRVFKKYWQDGQKRTFEISGQ